MDTDKPPVEPRLPRRFFGTVRLVPIRAGRDMSVVTDEVVKHRTALPRRAASDASRLPRALEELSAQVSS